MIITYIVKRKSDRFNIMFPQNVVSRYSPFLAGLSSKGGKCSLKKNKKRKNGFVFHTGRKLDKGDKLIFEIWIYL